jgi:hypothetical protein
VDRTFNASGSTAGGAFAVDGDQLGDIMLIEAVAQALRMLRA